MPQRFLQGDSCLKQPRKGISAEVLIDGLSPSPARDVFDLDPRFSLLVRYLLDCDRGFTRRVQVAQFPKPATITLASAPEDLTQLRIAFGLTLLLDVQEAGARMGLKLVMKGRTAARFIQARETEPCIKFLEVLEGVDDLTVKYRYREKTTNSVVKGSISL